MAQIIEPAIAQARFGLLDDLKELGEHFGKEHARLADLRIRRQAEPGLPQFSLN
jgi:hypothetical protein